MSGSSLNNYTTFAAFLLSCGAVSPAAAANYGANQQFLEKIGFCPTDARTIAEALKSATGSGLTKPPLTGPVLPPQTGPRPPVGTGPSPGPTGPVQLKVPPGWLVGLPRPGGPFLTLTVGPGPGHLPPRIG